MRGNYPIFREYSFYSIVPPVLSFDQENYSAAFPGANDADNDNLLWICYF